MYKIKNKEIQELKNTIENKALAPTVEYPNYKLGGETLCFYKRTEAWQAPISSLADFFNYYKDENNPLTAFDVTYRDGLCTFNNNLVDIAPAYNTYYYIVDIFKQDDQANVVQIDAWVQYDPLMPVIFVRSWTDITADRLVILLQAPGGGGGGSSQVFILGGSIGGEDGGGGGSGGFLAFVLNTKYLKTNGGNLRIKLGANGKGFAYNFQIQDAEYYKWGDNYIYLGGDTYGLDGEDGVDCEVIYTPKNFVSSPIKLFTVGGGKGGKAARSYEFKGPGAGGIVSITDEAKNNYGPSEQRSCEETLYWLIPIYDKSNVKVADGTLNGVSGGNDSGKAEEQNGKSTPKYKLRLSKIKNNSTFTYSIGGRPGGNSFAKATETGDAATFDGGSGGGASYFKGGGDCGSDNYFPINAGQPGGIGAGGGGGIYCYGGYTSINNGGDGGVARLMIFY